MSNGVFMNNYSDKTDYEEDKEIIIDEFFNKLEIIDFSKKETSNTTIF
jgi:hypothetical protein